MDNGNTNEFALFKFDYFLQGEGRSVVNGARTVFGLKTKPPEFLAQVHFGSPFRFKVKIPD